MAVKIKRAGEEVATKPDPRYTRHPEVIPEQIEVFGRLRLTNAQIADYYGLSVYTIGQMMKRPDLERAYKKGMAETVVAIRQKQLQLALAGSERMLIHAGQHFGDQSEDAASKTPDDFEPSRFSWDAELKQRIALARAAVQQGAGQASPETA